MPMPEPLERNGFRLTAKMFTTPQNATSLDPVSKRKVTICNLFGNHRLSIADIVRVLDENYKHVVGVLNEEGFVHEWRRNPEKTLGRSQSIRCLENVRRNYEDWGRAVSVCSFLQPLSFALYCPEIQVQRNDREWRRGRDSNPRHRF